MDQAVGHQVSCGLLVRAGRVLLVHRSPTKPSHPNVWDLPGGHRQPGESGRQALVRELREELNVAISPPAGSAVHTRRDGGLFVEVWRIDDWDGDVVNAAPDEHDEIAWFSVDEASTLDLADRDYPALFARMLP